MSSQDEPDGPALNPAAMVAALNRHQVRYVVIGAFAAIAQQAPIPAIHGDGRALRSLDSAG